jgi:hypothetical protein
MQREFTDNQYKHFYEGLLTPLGYWLEDKERYDKGYYLGNELNTYLRWKNDNDHEAFCKKNKIDWNRYESIKSEYEKYNAV